MIMPSYIELFAQDASLLNLSLISSNGDPAFEQVLNEDKGTHTLNRPGMPRSTPPEGTDKLTYLIEKTNAIFVILRHRAFLRRKGAHPK